MTSIETLLFGQGIRSLKPGLLIYNEVRQDREDGFTPRALDAPDGEAAQADTGIMGVACQAPASATGVLVAELQADGQEKGQYTFEERLAIVQQVSVGRFIVAIDGDGAIVPCLCGGCGQCVTPRASGLIC